MKKVAVEFIREGPLVVPMQRSWLIKVLLRWIQESLFIATPAAVVLIREGTWRTLIGWIIPDPVFTAPVSRRSKVLARDRSRRSRTIEEHLSKLIPVNLPVRRLKRAKPEDLKKIARKISNDFWIEAEARTLGFALSEKQIEEIRGRIQARIKRKNKLAIKKAKENFSDAIFFIRPKCNCGSMRIMARASSHHHDAPGPIVIGPGGNPGYTSHEIVCLYCEDCGLTYYNSQVENLSQRYAKGDFEPNLERTSRSPSNHLWTDPMISFRGS